MQANILLNLSYLLLRFLFRGFGNDNFEDDRLTIGDQRTLAARQFCQERQFHSLHRRFNASQAISPNQDLMLRKDQTKTLILCFTLQFSESKFVMGQ